jgi:sulfoxide reductase catalytic subunit YedY
MGMLIKKAPDIPWSQITPEGAYINRRRFIEMASVLSISALSASAWAQTKKGPYDTDEKQTPFRDVTTYNNFL